MEKDRVKQIQIQTKRIAGGITLRDPEAFENGNMALHVCQHPDLVLANRKHLARQTLPLSRWALCWQRHTDAIVEMKEEDCGKGAWTPLNSVMNADALYTTVPNLLIGVFTADCLGILLADDTIPLVCAVHSGWKGTAQNLLYKTLDHLNQKGLLRPESLQVFFSPSLQKDSFEIGPEVADQLLQAGASIGLDYFDLMAAGREDRMMADHQAMNVRVLLNAGIPGENIHTSTLDTKKNPCCFSFRRDTWQTGEHFTYGYIRNTDVPDEE